MVAHLELRPFALGLLGLLALVGGAREASRVAAAVAPSRRLLRRRPGGLDEILRLAERRRGAEKIPERQPRGVRPVP